MNISFMESHYPIRAWDRSTEDDIINCLQEVYLKRGYVTKNFHATDRIHELGTDLECAKGKDKIAFAVKKKPRKHDIKQLNSFATTTKNKKAIYVFIEPPTRPFEQVAQTLDSVTFWNALELHKELIENESNLYLRLYFSAHLIVETLAKVHEIIYEKRNTSYQKRKLTTPELDSLWITKDNIVKMRSMLLNVYSRWTKKLMTKTSRKPQEYQKLINQVFEELDVVNLLSGEKLVSSFQEIAYRHPNLFGLYWDNVRQRTNWIFFAVGVEKLSPEAVSSFIRSKWIIPSLPGSPSSVMRGFYSNVNYILENYHTVAKNLEDGIDWVFEDMTR